MRLDSHQHFWRYSEAEYPWMKPDWPIRRDYLPEHLAPEVNDHGLDGCVAVQARQSLAETRWLLELADTSPIIKGVVGWVDLKSPQVSEQLAEFSHHPRFVGVRHVVQDEPDDRFMLGADFQRGIAKLRTTEGEHSGEHRSAFLPAIVLHSDFTWKIAGGQDNDATGSNHEMIDHSAIGLRIVNQGMPFRKIVKLRIERDVLTRVTRVVAPGANTAHASIEEDESAQQHHIGRGNDR